MATKHDVPPLLAAAIAASRIRTEHVAEYPLAAIKSSIQVRADQIGADGEEHLNGAKVREYTARFKAGQIPPPIGICRDGVLVFGNHRRRAAEKAGWSDLPAIVFDVDGDGADEHTLSLLMTFSGRENVHGLPHTNKDKDLLVPREIEIGTSNAVIMGIYGVTAPYLAGLRREMYTDERLLKLGIPSALKGRERAVKRALAGPDAKALTDPSWQALVELAVDAELRSPEINSLAGEARAKGTEDGAIVAVANKRSELAHQIAEVEATGQRERPTPLTRLRKVSREVTGLCEKADAAAYRDFTDSVDETRKLLDDAIACLQHIRAAQDA